MSIQSIFVALNLCNFKFLLKYPTIKNLHFNIPVINSFQGEICFIKLFQADTFYITFSPVNQLTKKTKEYVAENPTTRGYFSLPIHIHTLITQFQTCNYEALPFPLNTWHLHFFSTKQRLVSRSKLWHQTTQTSPTPPHLQTHIKHRSRQENLSPRKKPYAYLK